MPDDRREPAKLLLSTVFCCVPRLGTESRRSGGSFIKKTKNLSSELPLEAVGGRLVRPLNLKSAVRGNAALYREPPWSLSSAVLFRCAYPDVDIYRRRDSVRRSGQRGLAERFSYACRLDRHAGGHPRDIGRSALAGFFVSAMLVAVFFMRRNRAQHEKSFNT